MANKLKITLVRSMIGRPEAQRKVFRGTGLTKMHTTEVLEDTPCIRGMVLQASHLGKAEEVSE